MPSPGHLSDQRIEPRSPALQADSLPSEPPGKSLVLEDPLEEEMATNSSILAWEIPWTEELGGLQLQSGIQLSD